MEKNVREYQLQKSKIEELFVKSEQIFGDVSKIDEEKFLGYNISMPKEQKSSDQATSEAYGLMRISAQKLDLEGVGAQMSLNFNFA